MVLWKSGLTIQGSDAERLAIPATSLQAGWKFLVLEDFIEFMWNGAQWIPIQTTDGVIMSDNFDGTTIDTSKWLETDPDNRISQNNEIIYTAPGVNQGTNFRNRMTTILSLQNGTMECIADMDAIVSSQPQEFCFGVYRDQDNVASFNSRGGLGTDTYKLVVRQGGVDQLNSTQSESLDNLTCKVQYNFDTKVTKFFIDIAGAWSQRGGDQNFDLDGGNPMFGVIGENVNNSFFVNSNVRVDNFKLVKGVLQSPP